MKIWRVNINTSDEGTLVGWAPNQQAARDKARQILEDAADGRRFDKTTDSIEPVEIPTDKPGLIRWLSVHLKTDNG